MDALIEKFERKKMKEEIPEFKVGDTVRVSSKIVEGEKERLQVLQGTVIARKGGGLSETFSIHRVSYGEGMERVFYLHSPRIVKIEVIKKGIARRAKLYHLRGKTGKAAKIKEKISGERRERLTDESVGAAEEITDQGNETEIMASAHAPEPVESSTKE